MKNQFQSENVANLPSSNKASRNKANWPSVGIRESLILRYLNFPFPEGGSVKYDITDDWGI